MGLRQRSTDTTESTLRHWRHELAACQLHDTCPAGQVSWIVAEPFQITESLTRDLIQLGEDIRLFLRRCDALTRQPAIRRRIDPTLSTAEHEALQRMPGATGFPMLVRPDIVLDATGKPWIVEIDLHPAHAGVLQRLQEIQGTPRPIAARWAETFPGPVKLSVPQWKPFTSEHRYFAERVRDCGGQLDFLPIEEWSTLADYDGILFQNCCTLSLQSAAYPAFVPPQARIHPQPLLDWKGWLAMTGEVDCLGQSPVVRWIPESYLLPLDPDRHADRRRAMIDLSRRQKTEWIIKPLTSWGSRGYRDGESLSRDDWNRLVLGLANNGDGGHLLQRKVVSQRFSITGLTPDDRLVKLDQLRTRLGPYYILTPDRSQLAGVLLTLRRSSKVHTSTDAVHTLAEPAPIASEP